MHHGVRRETRHGRADRRRVAQIDPLVVGQAGRRLRRLRVDAGDAVARAEELPHKVPADEARRPRHENASELFAAAGPLRGRMIAHVRFHVRASYQNRLPGATSVRPAKPLEILGGL